MHVCLLQGSATLSMAYAAALFADAVLRGLNGSTATECAYVDSDVTDVPYFATKVKLGTEGERGGAVCCFFGGGGCKQGTARGTAICGGSIVGWCKQ